MSDVTPVQLPGPPLLCVSNLGDDTLRLLDIRRLQIEKRLRVHRFQLLLGLLRADGLASCLGKLCNDAAGQLCSGVGTQSPACIDVAECKHQIGDTLEHGALPDVAVCNCDGLAIYGQGRLAQQRKPQAGGSDDDVWPELLARVQLDRIFRDTLNRGRLDAALAASNGLEKVGVGAQAHALVPGVVSGRKVGVQRRSLGQLALCAAQDDAPGQVGHAATKGNQEKGRDDPFEADDRVC